jgi:uncharacterized metal-binding protein YceD (DUF177 family)
LKNRADLSEFDIKFVGLKIGKHNFQFKINNDFISKFQDALIDNLDINLNFTLDKQSDRLFLMEFEFSGSLGLECDRCLQSINYPVKQHYRIVLKVDNTEKNSDDDVIFVSSNDFKVNIASYVYEFVSLLVPMKKTCETINQKCDQQMLKIINNFSVKTGLSEEKNDNNWNILKNLKNN